MIDLGEPLHAADTAFVRASPEVVFALLTDPFGWPAFWPRMRTFDHKVTCTGTDEAVLTIGDRWHLRALLGAGGIDVEAEVTDRREVPETGRHNLWMDWRGSLDPLVGLPFQPRAFEAETEWWVRPWHSRGTDVGGTLVSFFWRTRSEPLRRQQRLMANLRRLGWRAMHGLKTELEGCR